MSGKAKTLMEYVERMLEAGETAWLVTPQGVEIIRPKDVIDPEYAFTPTPMIMVPAEMLSDE